MLIVIIIGILIAISYSFFTLNHTAYTLYRGSIVNENYKIHIASFDANESETYNRENCEIALNLFQSQYGVKVKYWCDKN